MLASRTLAINMSRVHCMLNPSRLADIDKKKSKATMMSTAICVHVCLLELVDVVGVMIPCKIRV